MKVIGDRISILKKDNLLSIVILPTTNKTKLNLMFLWLLAWSVSGIIVLANYFRINDPDQKLFILVFLSFWAYFEFNIVRAFIWKKFGKEKLWIQEGILHYQREINKKGKIKEFNLDLISPLSMVELKPTRFADTINQSFWVKGGERIEFASQSAIIRLGLQISDKEAKQIVAEVNQYIP
jgi:hypothetical protein